MPSIKKTEYSPIFKDLDLQSKEVGETNDCTVRAIASVTGLSYAEAHAAMEAAGRVKGQGAYRHQTAAALKALGFDITRIDHKARIAKYPKIHRLLKNVTTHHFRRFPEAWGDLNGEVIAFTNDHCFAVLNSKNADWTINRKMHITDMWRIKTSASKPRMNGVSMKELEENKNRIKVK